MTPGQQFDRIMKRWRSEAAAKMAEAIGEKVAEDMKVHTERGESFPGEQYDNRYAPQTIEQRRRKGFQTSRVDLRRERKRITHTFTRKNGPDSSVTAFRPNTDRQGRSAGRIMFFHHHGIGRNPVRRIFPTKVNTVPKTARKIAMTKGREVFNGKKLI